MSINTFARKWSSNGRFIAIALALIAAMATRAGAGDDGPSEADNNRQTTANNRANNRGQTTVSDARFLI
jgi:hypothetical protein